VLTPVGIIMCMNEINLNELINKQTSAHELHNFKIFTGPIHSGKRRNPNVSEFDKYFGIRGTVLSEIPIPDRIADRIADPIVNWK